MVGDEININCDFRNHCPPWDSETGRKTHNNNQKFKQVINHPLGCKKSNKQISMLSKLPIGSERSFIKDEIPAAIAGVKHSYKSRMIDFAVVM